MKRAPHTFIMVVETTDWLHRLQANQLSLFTQKLHNSIENSLQKHSGKLIEFSDNHYVVSFHSVTDSVLCALKIQHKFKYSAPKVNNAINQLHIAIVENTKHITTSISLATFLCNSINDKIITTHEVKSAYEDENTKIKIDRERVKILTNSEKKLILRLKNYLLANWKDPYLQVAHLQKPLDYSASQIYSKLKLLTGKSPSEFIRDFRLRKAMESIHKQKGTMTSIAKSNGFGSPSYFSTSFRNRFGITPSEYSRLNY